MSKLINADELKSKFLEMGCMDGKPCYGAEIIDRMPTVQAIPIPDNSTNGDVIKVMFPCLEKYEYEELYKHGIALAGNDNRVIWFANDWWYAPYKRSSEE